MWYDTAPGLIVVDDGRIDEAFRNDSGLDKRIYNKVKDPLRDRVHFTLGEELFVSRTPCFHLTAVDVALPKEVSGSKWYLDWEIELVKKDFPNMVQSYPFVTIGVNISFILLFLCYS